MIEELKILTASEYFYLLKFNGFKDSKPLKKYVYIIYF